MSPISLKESPVFAHKSLDGLPFILVGNDVTSFSLGASCLPFSTCTYLILCVYMSQKDSFGGKQLCRLSKTHTFGVLCTQSYTRKLAHTLMRTHENIRAHTHTLFLFISLTRTRIHAHTYTHTHTHTCTHSNTRTYTHTYAHT